MKNTLYIVRGYPGQGKSAFAKKMLNCSVFENDMYFMHSEKYEYDKSKMPDAINWCMHMVINCLKEHMDVCVANTFTKAKFVESYVNLAKKFDADVKVIRMMGEFKNVHDVPTLILKNMMENFDDYDGELYAYPNLNQDTSDPCYRPYMFTNLKVGDKVKSIRRKDDGSYEDCICAVTQIFQGTYDYLNVHYIEDDTQKAGIAMSGDLTKL